MGTCLLFGDMNIGGIFGLYFEEIFVFHNFAEQRMKLRELFMVDMIFDPHIIIA